MKRLDIYLILIIITISLSLFLFGCLGKIYSDNASENQTSSIQGSPTQVCTTQVPSSQSNFWAVMKYAGIGFVIGLAICALTWFVISYFRNNKDRYDQGEASQYKNEVNYLNKNLARVEADLADTKRKYERYNRYESQIPLAEQQYRNASTEIGAAFPSLIGTNFKSLDGEPEKEYWAYVERTRALKSIEAYFVAEVKKAQTLKLECLELVNAIKDEDPGLFVAFQTSMSTATSDGLKALKPVLLQWKNQTEKKSVSDKLKNELLLLEKSLESIRDYSYRLISSRLIKFSYELIKDPASEKENELKEKTIREIINLINQYLRL